MSLSFRFLVPIVLLVLTAIYAATALGYDEGSRDMPLAVSLVVTVLLVMDIVMQTETSIGRALRKAFTGAQSIQKVPGEGETPVLKELAAFAWIAAFLVLAVIFGFYIAIPIYVFAYLRFYAGKSIVVSAIPAIAVVGLLYLLFQVMLGYEIFSGLIVGDYF